MTDPSPRTEFRTRRQARRRRTTILVGVLVVVLVGAAGGLFLATRSDGDAQKAAAQPTTSTTAPVAGPDVSTSFGVAPMRAAITKGGDIPVYTAPTADTQPMTTLSKLTPYNFPRSLLVFDQYQDWLHVYLPVRPNNTTGWIKASDVNVSQPLEWQVKVTLADHKLTLLHNGAVEFDAPVAIGTADNPTPTGTFYFTDPLDLANQPGGPYGVFAIGISGHSNTLSEFAGGDAQIAIHGTNDPSTIGQSVSHGCVRVNNDVVLKLSKLPIGTPVVIT
jgi:lipoprotein-anchoring transpeptidase ErfK/SrfK